MNFQANQQACAIVEETSTTKEEDRADISNLTAEIETFVRTHDTDQEKLRENAVKVPAKKKDKSPPIPPARTTSNAIATINETTGNDTAAFSRTTVTIERVPIREVVSNESHTDSLVVVHTGQPVRNESEITSSNAVDSDTERKQIIERKLGNSRESPENNEDYPERTSQTPDPVIDETVKMRKVNSVKKLNVNDNPEAERSTVDVSMQSPPKIIVRKATEDWECDEEIQLTEHVSCDESPKTPISSEVEFILEENANQIQKLNDCPDITNVEVVQSEVTLSLNDSKETATISVNDNDSVQSSAESSFENSVPNTDKPIQLESTIEDVPELKIVESTDDLTNTTDVPQSSDRYKIRFVALKNFSPEPQRRDIIEYRSHNNQSLDIEDVELPPAPPQRRRSVKDIIASINKSQSLLKINQKSNVNTEPKRVYDYDSYLPTSPIRSPLQPKPFDESMTQKYSELEESERKMRKMITDMEQSTINVPVPVIEKFDALVDDDDRGKSNDLFKKCVVRREKNLQFGASQDENRSSVEWNPLPKPRRSRNLSHELENGKI